jgi:hypothetical protein
MDMLRPPIRTYLDRLKDKVVRNEFEKMIVSRLSGEGISSTDQYFLSEEGRAPFAKVNSETFLAQWAKVFNVPHGQQPSVSKSALNSNFELDCCIQFSQPMALSEIFSPVQSAENIFTLNTEQPTWSEINVDPGEFIAFEFTEKVGYIPRKLYQIERMLHLQETCITGMQVPKAVGLVVNGQHRDFQESVRCIDKSRWSSDEEPKIFSLPVFVIYMPYRNVYSEVSDLKADVSALTTAVTALTTNVSALTTNMSALNDYIKEALRWPLMTRTELRAVCAAKGVEVSAFMSKNRILLALITHAPGGSPGVADTDAASRGEM